ncbi:phosphopantetheine-binding protein [Abyssibacter sp.]|jgi:acyl carrier protein|uniref:phosphopantetheine-binding protein n=1 Tax=Abyssibacter sp. TaxID=2320200 RepID=UPI000C56D4F5|nr:phosphopantetheine-binding protein [Abyssibacter sp.]MBB86238.1 acyl carrier protein [Xanthomonadales bacterium]MCK5860558.1 acyl carrier protein [Abyssibacter sp.]
MQNSLSQSELDIASLLVETLNLEDESPEDIEPEASLFGADETGLGLDSIDALEIAQAIAQKYGVQIRADDARNKDIFRSLRSLTEFVVANKD